MNLRILWCCLFLLGCWPGHAAEVCLAKLQGPIGPATSLYIGRSIEEAARRQAQCLIIQMDTPGGLLDTTREIVQRFYTSPVPIVVYVGPSGASAGSAGCFITLAADVAAMAPHTTIGAAHPVAIGGGGAEKLDDVMKQKLENFTTSYIETIADKRNRNVEWAKSSVQESASITSEKALELKVVEIIAADIPDLLRQLDGRVVQGKTLQTRQAVVGEIAPILRERFFQMLWRPETMFILMLMAIYGIIGELSNPGAILPGVVGGIALILALFMSAILPIQYAGLAMILLAIALFVIDIFAPTHGVLTAGGIVAFIFGSMMLFDRSDPTFRLSLSLIIPACLVTAAFFSWVVGAGLRAQWRPTKTGRQGMIGQIVSVTEEISATGGRVWIEGESWRAVSAVRIGAGAKVKVTGIQGLTLTVEPDATGK